jgi:hypothetical protein
MVRPEGKQEESMLYFDKQSYMKPYNHGPGLDLLIFENVKPYIGRDLDP